MNNKKKQEIPLEAFDNELIHQEIIIPDDFKATIEGNKIILTKTENKDERIKNRLIKLIKMSSEVGGFALHKWEADEMLAWLEKQGEQEVNEPDWCHHKVDLSDCSEEYRKAYYDGWNNCNQQHSQCNAEQKSADKDMVEALRTEYEKGRADVIADTISWLENCWPKYCSNQTIIEGFKEAIKYE